MTPLATITAPTTIDNTTTATVERDSETASSSASDSYTVDPDTVEVSGTKTITPEYVEDGGTSHVRLTARNDSPQSLSELTVPEPTNGEFGGPVEFAGFTEGVDWPATTSSASITYNSPPPTPAETVPFADGAIPPALSSGDPLSSSLTCEGNIEPGAETAVEFDVVGHLDGLSD